MDKILKKHDKARLKIRNNLKLLRIEGPPHERGFQHGKILASEINELITVTLDAAAAVIAKTIHCPFIEAKERMRIGAETAFPFIPDELKEEMRGIADGVSSSGFPEINFEKIILWNTMYDQWCIYAHPKHWNPYQPEEKSEYKGGRPGSFVLGGCGCSSFSAWGESAGADGSLIFGKNMDNLSLPGILENRLILIIKPDEGNSHACMTHPGMVGIDGGFNDKGISMMTQYNPSIHETMEGCGIGILSRTVLKNASTIDEAYNVFMTHPRCTGIAYHVADAKSNNAAIIEVSSEKVTRRTPENGESRLWTTNHSNSYPGWTGYEGYNMINDQALVYELDAVNTIENWQTSLKDPDNLYVAAPSRFERYRTLLDEYKGNINPDTAVQILCDRFDPYTGKEREKYSPSISNNILATICALYPEDTFFEDEPARSFKAHTANLWSWIIYPGKGDFRVAAETFPAQYGGYVSFNLFDELADDS
ncbi:MAG TPA: C45 family autoproteolytic acyltransferase/hydrolase [Spirochaetota bacterium]|nr:C45 family autoproteolytic acyltransferase/hydrolase [Spirochaetota bacterium]